MIEGSEEPVVRGRPARRVGLVLLLILLAGTAILAILHYRGGRFRPLSPEPGAAIVTSEPALPPSTIPIQIELDPASLAARLEAAVPRTFGDLEARLPYPANPRMSYGFVAERGPFTVEMVGDSIHLSSEVRFGGRLWFDSPFGGTLTTGCGAAGGPRPRARLHVAIPLELKPDWSLGGLPEAHLEPLLAGPEDRCVVAIGPLELDATETLLATAGRSLAELAASVGPLVTSSVRETAERSWRLLQEPYPLGRDAWLSLRPEGVIRGSLEMEEERPGRTLLLALRARPRITLGEVPDPGRRPLPELAPGSPGERFDLLVETRLGYEVVASGLAEALRGREFDLGGQPFRIVDLELSGTGAGRVALSAHFEGSARGTLHLIGSPTLDEAGDVVTLPDLRFAVETPNRLLRGAVWLLQGLLPEGVRDRVRWPVDPTVEEARGRATGVLPLRIEGVGRLTGGIDSLRPVQLRATEGTLGVVLRVEGRARLELGDR